MINRFVFVVFALSISLNLGANVDVYTFDNAEQESRYQTMVKELRCLVCQNQNLADSNADLAKDLRQKTYEMIKAGASDDEIVGYMVERYGDFVLYRPPVTLSTFFLWLGPFMILFAVLAALIILARKRRGAGSESLSQSQHEQARRLLDGEQSQS